VVEVIERKWGTRKISELGGLANAAPTLTIFLVVVALANIALPLTNAFVGEFLMFNGLFAHSKGVTAVALTSIILAAVYTLNMIQKVFYGEMKQSAVSTRAVKVSSGAIVALTVIVLIIFILGVYPKPLLELTKDSVGYFLGKIKGI